MPAQLFADGLTERRFRHVALDTDRDATRFGMAIRDS
jgi:hypothetical protein